MARPIFRSLSQLLREAEVKAAALDPATTVAQLKAELKSAVMQRTLSELLHLGVDLRDYYAPHVDKAMVLCVGHKVKDFVQQLARLFESGKDSLLDVKAMERVAQEMAAEDPKFQPLVYPFHRATDMQGESALAFLVSAA